MTNLNKLYGEYLARKISAKKQAKIYEYGQTEQERVALGNEMVTLLDAGLSRVEIATMLGFKGRVFVNECIAAYEANRDGTTPDTMTPPKSPTVPAQGVPEASEITYEIERAPGATEAWGVLVSKAIDGGPAQYHLYRDRQGDLVVPDEWATHSPELRAVYKRVIAEIEG